MIDVPGLAGISLASWQMILAAAAIGIMSAVLTRRAGATAAVAILAAALIAGILAWSQQLTTVGVVLAHLLLLLGLLLVVGVRTAPVEAAAGVGAAIAAGAIEPQAWLVAVAVPIAAFASGSARSRRFVGIAVITVLLLAAAGAYLLYRGGVEVLMWPPGDVTGPATVAGIPGLTAVVVGALAAGLSTRSRRAAQAGMANPTSRPLRRPAATSMVAVAAVLAGAAVGVAATTIDISAGTATTAVPSASSSGSSPSPPESTTSATPSATTSAERCREVVTRTLVATPSDDLVAAGAQLRLNPRISLCEASSAALEAGTVDGRILAVLALLAEGYEFRVDRLDATAAVVTSLYSATTGEPAALDAEEWLRAQVGPYAPSSVELLDDSSLRIAFAGRTQDT